MATGRLNLTLGGVWLIASVSTLLFPVFFPTYPYAHGFEGNAMAVSTLTMFLLSFPSSLIGTPLIFLMYGLLGIRESSLTAGYVTVVMLFAIGLVQWFWIVPRLLWRPTFLQALGLGGAAGNTRLFARDLTVWVDEQGATPLERVIEDEQAIRPDPTEDPRSQQARDEDSPL